MIDLTKTFIFWRSGVPNQKIHTHELEISAILWVYMSWGFETFFAPLASTENISRKILVYFEIRVIVLNFKNIYGLLGWVLHALKGWDFMCGPLASIEIIISKNWADFWIRLVLFQIRWGVEKSLRSS